MKVLVTGANGFLGRRVVRAATFAGHDVQALLRPGALPATELVDDERVGIVRGDLRAIGPWVEVAAQADAVVHLASATSGDLATQVAGSIRATELILGAVATDRLDRFVHVSSFSVYDLGALAPGSVVDEQTALEADPERRDPYTATKLFQELLVREAFLEHPERLVVLRPGMIYGPGHDWAWGVALPVGRRLGLVVAPRATMRLVHVDNCADAVVAALTAPRAGGATVDVVDDELPTHAGFLRLGRRVAGTTRLGLPVPWPVAVGIAHLAGVVDRRWFGARARMPELLASARLAARWTPLRYDNSRAHELLEWSPAVGLDEGARHTAGEVTR